MWLSTQLMSALCALLAFLTPITIPLSIGLEMYSWSITALSSRHSVVGTALLSRLKLPP